MSRIRLPEDRARTPEKAGLFTSNSDSIYGTSTFIPYARTLIGVFQMFGVL
jgi:hypothetical protein